MARKGEDPEGISRHGSIFTRPDPSQIQAARTVLSLDILEYPALHCTLFPFDRKLVQEIGYCTHRIFAHCKPVRRRISHI